MAKNQRKQGNQALTPPHASTWLSQLAQLPLPMHLGPRTVRHPLAVHIIPPLPLQAVPMSWLTHGKTMSDGGMGLSSYQSSPCFLISSETHQLVLKTGPWRESGLGCGSIRCLVGWVFWVKSYPYISRPLSRVLGKGLFFQQFLALCLNKKIRLELYF